MHSAARKLNYIGEFQVLQEIGQGASASIYKVEKDGCFYAIKLLRPKSQIIELDESRRFRKEAAFAARLRHPGHVHVYDIGEHLGLPFIVMEFVSGQTFDQYLKSNQRLNKEKFITFVNAVAGLLEEMHKYQMVHRDIKPSNVMLCDDGAVKLLDLGLAGSADELLVDIDSEAKEFVGTLAYSAPEQSGVLKRPIDRRTDLYSLGVTLYELMTGQLPFKGTSVSEILHQQASYKAPSPHEVDPSISRVISRIIDKLLQKDPDDRYQSATGLLADVQRIDELEKLSNNGQEIHLGEFENAHGIQSNAPLTGRQQEYQVLSEAWKQAQGGYGKIVFIEGEGGSGKSRLAQEITTEANKSKALVLAGKCDAISSSVPLAFLRATFDDYCHQIFKLPEEVRLQVYEHLKIAAGDAAPTISRISLGLEKILNQSSTSSHAVGGISQQEIFFKEVARFIVNLAKSSRGLLFKIDDIQWADQSTLNFLEELGHAISDSPILVACTARNDAESQSALQKICKKFNSKDLIHIELQPLTLDAIHELTRALLGHNGLESHIVEKLAAVTNGNPFAISEYLNSLLSEGHLQYKGNSWSLNGDGLVKLSLSKNVYDLILSRLQNLEMDILKVLSVAAVIGNRFEIDFVKDASGTDEKFILSAIEVAMKNNLINSVDSKTYHFVHDRIREAIISSMNEEHLREVNDRLAKTLDQRKIESPEQIFSIARFYSSGNIEANAHRVFETNLEAGVLASKSYAYEQAYSLLTLAKNILQKTDADNSLVYRLYLALGTSCMNTGRIAEAHECFNVAFKICPSRFEKTKLMHLISYTYSSEGKVLSAWQSFKEALQSIGSPYPSSRLKFTLSLLALQFASLFLLLTGFGYGRLRKPGKERKLEKQTLICDIYDTAYMNAYLRSSPLDLTQITFQLLYRSHFIGDSSQVAKSHIYASMLFGLMNMKKLMDYHRKISLKIAEGLKDPGLMAFVRTREVLAIEMCGDTITSAKLSTACATDVHRYCGSWLHSEHIMELAHQYLARGYTQEAVSYTQNLLGELDKTNNLTFKAISRGLLWYQLLVLGRPGETIEIFKEWAECEVPVADTNFAIAYRQSATMAVLYEEQNFDENLIEAEIKKFQSYHIEDYHYTIGYIHLTYLRMIQYERAKGTEREAEFAKKFFYAILGLRFRARTPVFRCHAYILRATKLRVDGKPKKALELLNKAEKDATKADSVWAQFMLVKERARCELALGNKAGVDAHVHVAYHLAKKHNWLLRIDQMRKEFNISSLELSVASNDELFRSKMTGNFNDKRTIESLLQVSLAASSTVDPMEQARKALDEIIRVMGAERGFVFLWNEADNTLHFRSGRDSSKSDLKELIGYSSTVVNRVCETREPLILTGSDQMEAIGSESAVINDLRSIMAVPLFLRENFMGVVYVDSRVAKGLFTANDIEVLRAISNHIAIAVESSRMAQMEINRRSMEKDLEVSAAVQTMFLPRAKQHKTQHFELNGFYRPASQCGGDWWWYRASNNDKLYLIIADVTGHGAGPAMITAAVATTFRFMERNQTEISLPEMIRQTDEELKNLSDGEFCLALFAAEFDFKISKVTYWSAGVPYPFQFSKTGERKAYDSNPGSILGMGDTVLGSGTIDFEKGDRFIFYTDGITEMRTPDGREFGERRAGRTFSKLATQNGQDTIKSLIQDLDQLRGEEPQEDDFTLVLVDIAKD